MKLRSLLLAGVIASGGGAQAAVVSTFSDLASWQAAITGPSQVQDFSGFADGASLIGVDLLPGLTLSTNSALLEVFGGNKVAFGYTGSARADGNSFYEASYALPYRAIAFDITAFEQEAGSDSKAQGPGTLTLNFSDGSTQDLLIDGTPDGDPIFFGLVSDFALTSFRWSEPLEGSGGNEESGFDNFRVAMRGDGQVPLPGTLALALLGVALARRLRAAQ